MKFKRMLSVKNLKRRPVRAAALIFLAAVLSFSMSAGAVVITSLRRGLGSYESRLGADVVVIPNQARSHGTLEAILLQGIPGYFYMDGSCLNKIRNMDGVETASPQFFLASASAGCCSVPVQLTGFDPETDFLIRPWIRESYKNNNNKDIIDDGELIVGSGITVPKNKKLVFYNTECEIVARLDKTGTGLDYAVYSNMNTIKSMMKNAQALGFHAFDHVDADQSVSSVLVRVKDGYNIESVTDDINLHVRRVEATRSKNMIAGIAGGLSGVSRVIGILIGAVWILSIGILAAASGMIIRERTREFGVLRVIGASGGIIAGLILTESALINFIGGALGVLITALCVAPFSTLIRESLALPYLMPGTVWILILLMISILLTVIAGALPAAFFALKLNRGETALLLRENA